MKHTDSKTHIVAYLKGQVVLNLWNAPLDYKKHITLRISARLA